MCSVCTCVCACVCIYVHTAYQILIDLPFIVIAQGKFDT